MQPFSGFNTALANAAGLPADVAAYAMRKAGIPVGEKPVMGSEWIKEKLGTEQFPPRSATERALRAGGEGVGYALVPQAALEATAARAAPTVARGVAETLFGATNPQASALSRMATTGGNVALNLGAGMGSELASEAVPDKWKTWAGVGGGLAGGLGAQGVTGLAKTIVGLPKATYQYFRPITEAGQRAEAGRQLAAGAANPMTAAEALEGPQKFLPGSPKPTTFEATGDVGLGQMQRRAETKAPEAFLERRGEQAKARQEAFEGVAAEGDTMQLPEALKRQMVDFAASEKAVADRAEAMARKHIESMGGSATPEEYGSILRGYAQQAKDEANAARRALYDAVDPNGDLTVVTSGVKNIANDIVAQNAAAGPLAKPLEGDLAAIVDAASGISDVTPFSALRAFDTRISDALRQELQTNGETNTYRLLARMKAGVLDAINNAPENQAAYLERAQAAGVTPPALPNMTEDAASALKAAKAAHQDYVERFRSGPTGDVLRPGGGKGEYKLAFDAKVGPKFFQPGPAGFEAANSFRSAVGGDPAALGAMSDYIVHRAFRDTVDSATGLVDPKRFDAWKARHQDALRAFPEISQKLSDASRVSEIAGEIAAQTRANVENAQSKAFGRIIGSEDPKTLSSTVGQILSGRNGQTVMADIVRATRNNPDALAGLRRSVADYMRQNFMSVGEVGASGANAIKPDAFQKFVRNNRAALETVFDKEHVNTLQAIANDLNRSARSVTGSALTGRSTTAQDKAGLGNTLSTLGSIMKIGGAIAAPIAGGAAVYGPLGGGPIGAIGAAGSVALAEVANGARMAGMRKVDDLVTQALLDPTLAKELLRAAPRKNVPAAGRTIRQRLISTGAMGAQQSLRPQPDGEERIARATGGAVNLTALAKSARKHVTLDTKPLLGEHDETVARALEIAGKHI